MKPEQHAMPDTEQQPLLQVRNLSTAIDGVKLIDAISFNIRPGETLGVVGESGSGKSTLGLSLLKLMGNPKRVAYSGEVLFGGKDILSLGADELRQLRGRDMAMILQDPMTSLDPVFSVGNQVAEAIECHGQVSRQALRNRVIDALNKVRITEPESRVNAFPHQLSGGMRQRVVGAIAVSCEPRLLIADEPTTSLDATIQMQFLQLLQDIQADMGLSIMIITHDFGVVAKMCHRVCVMYGGNIVEAGPVEQIFDRPAHPYTRALMDSRPRLDQKPRRLVSIAGAPPKPTDVISGCKFAARCEHARPECGEQLPPVTDVAADHQVRCFFPLDKHPEKGSAQ